MGASQDTQLSCQLEVVTTGTRLTVSGAGKPQVNVQNPQKVQMVDLSHTQIIGNTIG